MKNRPTQVRARFKAHDQQLGISTITLGELAYGAEASARPSENLAVVEAFVARVEVLPFDALAAMQFGQLRAEFKTRGTPIGPYDQLIAAHARSLGLILVTNNMREFERVRGLRVENWLTVTG